MIKFKRIEYQNFLSTGNTPISIDLDRSSATLVVGSNGAGKSTMLDALSFALFGKPHRNINRPQLINSINDKKMLVVCEFEIGSNSYKIVRGMKPSIFEIHLNGKMLNQESHVRDYQKVLEQNILKLNHKSFHQVVVLGSGNFVPFMQLPTQLRRGVIEDLLDINIFTRMNSLVKERNSNLKNSIKDTDHQLDLLKTQIDLKEKHIRKLEEIDLEKSTRNEKKIDEIKSEISLLEERNSALQNEYDKNSKIINDEFSSISNQENQLEMSKIELRNEIKKIVKESKFYEDNDTCPTCKQSIGEDIKNEKKADTRNKAKDVNSKLKSVQEQLLTISQKVKESFMESERMREINSNINLNIKMIANLSNNIKDLMVEDEDTSHIDEERKELEIKIQEKSKIVDHKSDQIEERSYYDAITELLKDSGIKTKIIREYLPVMNKLINKYLNILDFFVLFNIDEGFNEIIKSRHRDEFTYASFSEGEKQRIDLALLFTWRQISKMKNSANTNLLILDETFDSSMDSDGVDNLIKILYTLREDSNVFIISHKQDMLEGKFPAKIEFIKSNNFSSIKS